MRSPSRLVGTGTYFAWGEETMGTYLGAGGRAYIKLETPALYRCAGCNKVATVRYWPADGKMFCRETGQREYLNLIQPRGVGWPATS